MKILNAHFKQISKRNSTCCICMLGQVANIDFFLHPFQGMFVEVFHDSCSKKYIGTIFFSTIQLGPMTDF